MIDVCHNKYIGS